MKKLEIAIPIKKDFIKGNLTVITDSPALVIFAHGSGSSRFSSRNQYVADILHNAKISTLLFDLLTEKEEQIDQVTHEIRFDIPLLTDRLITVTQWMQAHHDIKHMNIGYFGSSTGAAAALIAASQLPADIFAVVSRGGRTDLANDYLHEIQAATLLIVGEKDYDVMLMNENSYDLLTCRKKIHVVPNATHLFEEEGALEEVAKMAAEWFSEFFG